MITLRSLLCRLGWHAKPFKTYKIRHHCSHCGKRIIPKVPNKLTDKNK